MSSSNSPCAACKCLRRKCTQGCVFAPYFPPDQPSKFSDVHRVFGASNVAKLLNDLSPAQREDAVNSLAYEANARLKDPVYGCVGYISILQQRLKQVKQELDTAKRELSTYIGPVAHAPFIGHSGHHHPALMTPHHLQAASASVMPPFGIPGIGMGLGLMAPGASPHAQMLFRDQQQHQHMVEAQQQLALVAAEATREQELLRSYEQQQQQQPPHEFVRINSGFDAGGRGFSQMGGGGGATSVAVAPPQAMVPEQQFEGLFHAQQHFPEQQEHQQQHHRAGSGEGRSGIGPS